MAKGKKGKKSTDSDGLIRSFRVTSIILLTLILSPVLLPVLLIKIFLVDPYREQGLIKRVQKEWFPQGKYALFVYSDSPNWKEYIETNILPGIAEHAVVMNWSERSRLDTEDAPLELMVFRMWSGLSRYRLRGRLKYEGDAYNPVAEGDAYNPVAIVFTPDSKPKVIKFWQAFRDYKHGKEAPLKEKEAELFDALAKAGLRF